MGFIKPVERKVRLLIMKLLSFAVAFVAVSTASAIYPINGTCPRTVCDSISLNVTADQVTLFNFFVAELSDVSEFSSSPESGICKEIYRTASRRPKNVLIRTSLSSVMIPLTLQNLGILMSK